MSVCIKLGRPILPCQHVDTGTEKNDDEVKREMKICILRDQIPHLNTVWIMQIAWTEEGQQITENRGFGDLNIKHQWHLMIPLLLLRPSGPEWSWQSNSIKIQWGAIQIHTDAKQRPHTRFLCSTLLQHKSPKCSPPFQSNWIHSSNNRELMKPIKMPVLTPISFSYRSFKWIVFHSDSKSKTANGCQHPYLWQKQAKICPWVLFVAYYIFQATFT